MHPSIRTRPRADGAVAGLASTLGHLGEAEPHLLRDRGIRGRGGDAAPPARSCDYWALLGSGATRRFRAVCGLSDAACGQVPCTRASPDAPRVMLLRRRGLRGGRHLMRSSPDARRRRARASTRGEPPGRGPGKHIPASRGRAAALAGWGHARGRWGRRARPAWPARSCDCWPSESHASPASCMACPTRLVVGSAALALLPPRAVRRVGVGHARRRGEAGLRSQRRAASMINDG